MQQPAARPLLSRAGSIFWMPTRASLGNRLDSLRAEKLRRFRQARMIGGDDLFLSTVVSVDVETGRMNWYYQTTPGDNWDYSSAMDIAVGEIELSGEMRKVLLQAPKNGQD